MAENKAQSILNEALFVACHSCLSTSDIVLDISPSSPKPKAGAKLRRRPDGSIESGYGSNASAINWDRLKSHIRTEEKISPAPPSAINRCNLRCPESSPESGYGSGGSGNHPKPCNVSPLDTGEDISSSENSKKTGTVFLFPEPASQQNDAKDHGLEFEMLDELSEIERIKRIEFDPNRQEKDVPITTL